MKNEKTEPKRKILSLTLTENCNLNCVYCYERDKTRKSMDSQIAKDSIRNIFENSDGYDEVEIDLFGGEPTLEKELIKELVEWTCKEQFSKPFLFFLQTNGTLIHGEFQDWLVNHKRHIMVGLSLDGTPETQNRNRSNSYDQIDADFFIKHYPNQGVRMTISCESVGNLFNDVIHLHNLGFSKIDAFFALGTKWDSESIEQKLKPQIMMLCDYYLEHPELKECELLNIPIMNLKDSNKSQKWCGTGVEMLSVGVDGKKYPCHAFQPNTNTKPLEIQDVNFNEIKDFSDSECSSCIIESVCPNCYGLNHMMNGDMLKRDKQFCEITKARVMAVAYLKANQIARGDKQMSPGETYKTIESIQMVNKCL